MTRPGKSGDHVRAPILVGHVDKAGNRGLLLRLPPASSMGPVPSHLVDLRRAIRPWLNGASGTAPHPATRPSAQDAPLDPAPDSTPRMLWFFDREDVTEILPYLSGASSTPPLLLMGPSVCAVSSLADAPSYAVLHVL